MLEHGSITVKKLADLAGVSRGTVDRVLHGRPEVDPAVRDRVLRLADEVGYQRNRAAQALGFNKRPLKLGLVMPGEVPFFDGVRAGVDRALGELRDFGLRVRTEFVSRSEPGDTVRALDALVASGVQGLVVTAMDDPSVVAAVDRAVLAGVPVVTYNSDLATSRRACFVGQDLVASGRIAAGLMARMLPASAPVLVMTGALTYEAQSSRLAGFRDGWHGPVVVVAGHENRATEEAELRHALATHPDLRGLYVAAGSLPIALKVLQHRPGDRVRVVCNDLLPEVRAGLETGTIDFTVLQNEAEQGYRPLRLLFAHLNEGTPLPRGPQYVNTTIEIRETLRRTP